NGERSRKRRIQPRKFLRIYAPALDPTSLWSGSVTTRCLGFRSSQYTNRHAEELTIASTRLFRSDADFSRNADFEIQTVQRVVGLLPEFRAPIDEPSRDLKITAVDQIAVLWRFLVLQDSFCPALEICHLRPCIGGRVLKRCRCILPESRSPQPLQPFFGVGAPVPELTLKPL